MPRIRSTIRSDCHSSSGEPHGRSRKLGWPVRATSWNCGSLTSAAGSSSCRTPARRPGSRSPCCAEGAPPRRRTTRSRRPACVGFWSPSTVAPATVLCSISQTEWSMQMIPIPFAPSTTFLLAMSIDISPRRIPRSVVPTTWLCITSTIGRVRGDALARPDDRAAGDHAHRPPHRVVDEDAADQGPAGEVTEQSLIITPASSARIPSSVDAEDADMVEHDVAARARCRRRAHRPRR